MSARHRPASRRGVLRPALASVCLLGLAAAPLPPAHAAEAPGVLFQTTAPGGLLVRGGSLAGPATVELPAPDSVLSAVLTWTGAGTGAGADRLRLTPPAASSGPADGEPAPLTVPAAGRTTTGVAHRDVADVTALLRSAGPGAWTVAAPAGPDDPQATWSLTVAYGDPGLPPTTLQVLADGTGRRDGVPVAWPRPAITTDDVTQAHTGTPVTIPVLANDADPADLGLGPDGLAVTAVSQPAATLGQVTSDGRAVTFAPAATFRAGSATFDYTVSDATGATATAHVTVTMVDRSPAAQADALVLTGRAGSTWRLDVVGNDTDPDGDPLQLASVTEPKHGVATVAGHQVAYRPEPGFTGRDRFDYLVADGRGGTARQTVSVTVADRAPQAADDVAAVRAAEPLRVDVLAGDTDPDGDALRLVGVGTPAHGTARVVDGAVLYRSSAGFEGSDEVAYRVRDARGATASGTLRVTVVPGGSAADTRAAAASAPRATVPASDGSPTRTSSARDTSVTITESRRTRFTGVVVSDQTIGAASASTDTRPVSDSSTQAAPTTGSGVVDDGDTLPNTGGPSGLLTALGGGLLLAGGGLLGADRRSGRRRARHHA